MYQKIYVDHEADTQGKAMVQTRHRFTLIELLVVITVIARCFRHLLLVTCT